MIEKRKKHHISRLFILSFDLSPFHCGPVNTENQLTEKLLPGPSMYEHIFVKKTMGAVIKK